jgi:hypothetical protein
MDDALAEAQMLMTSSPDDSFAASYPGLIQSIQPQLYI